MISKKATDLIIQHEVGGRAYYDKKLQAPIEEPKINLNKEAYVDHSD